MYLQTIKLLTTKTNKKELKQIDIKTQTKDHPFKHVKKGYVWHIQNTNKT